MMSPCRFGLAVWLLVMGSGVIPARGQPSPRFREEAKRRNQVATQTYQSGQFELALQQYQSAYDLYPDPAFLFNIGLAREKTFDYEGCALAFERFLREAKQIDGDVRTQAEQRRASCLERALIPVKVTSVPTNAAIYLGEPSTQTLKGRTPQELKLGIGPTHQVTVEQPGYVTQTQTLTLKPGDRPQLDFVLEKLSVITIEADPAGASVRVDDGEWLQAPATVEVTAGPHVVEVTKEGYERERKEVRVRMGQDASLTFPLRAARIERWLQLRVVGNAGVADISVNDHPVGGSPVRVKVEPGKLRLAVKAAARIPFADDIDMPEDHDLHLVVDLAPTRSLRNRAITWSLGGSSGVAGVIGGIFGVLSFADTQRLKNNPSPSLSDRAHSRAVTADAFFLSAAILAAGAVTFHYITTPKHSTAMVDK